MPEVELTRDELRALRKCATEPIPLAKNERLVRHHLAYEIIEPVPGRFGNRTGLLSITDEGRDYLISYDARQTEIRKERRHDWLTTLLSTFGGALLSKPVWAVLGAIWDWITSLI